MNKKLITAFIGFSTVLLSLTGCSAKSEPQPETTTEAVTEIQTTKVAFDPSYEGNSITAQGPDILTLSLPSNWVDNCDNGAISGQLGSYILQYLDIRSAIDGAIYTDNLTIQYVDYTGYADTPLDTYGKMINDAYTAKGDYIIEDASMMADSIYKLSYTDDNHNPKLGIRQYIVKKDKVFYIMTYTFSAKSVATNTDIMDEIAQTITFE